MTHLVFETALLILIAFAVGCLVGVAAKHFWLRGVRKSVESAGGRTTPAHVDTQTLSAQANRPALARSADDEAAPMSTKPVRPCALPGPRSGRRDDLRAITGINAKLENVLNGLGIFHFDQVAAWSPENMAWLDAYLGLHGRIERERWIEQASGRGRTRGA